ncbi:MAG: UbiX family flavin prenyltransferase [Burkholderiaceae bacterium]|nr:UbiX family flavin prenyltransferase [Burkholderiaceae bacterium]
MKRLIVGISGASGVVYGVRLLEMLRAAGGVETHLVMTPAARLNVEVESALPLPRIEALADVVHSARNVGATIASGSFRTDGMIVAPCSIRTLSAIAHSLSDNLLTRAADVVLKERRRLVLMVRETPLHAGHCKLMYEASMLGAIIAPPVPAMYARPQTIDDVVDHSCARVLDLFDIDVGRLERWAGLGKVAAGT